MKSNNKITINFFKSQIPLLKENYITDNEEPLHQFSIAVERFCYFIFEIDKLIDGDSDFVRQHTEKRNGIYDMMKNHQDAVKSLGKLFPDDEHMFWNDLNVCSEKYYKILIREKYENSARHVLSLSDFEDYAVSKHSLAYIPVKGLGYLFEYKISPAAIESIFTEIFCGIQMVDDIEDFNADLFSGQWTYVHSRVEEFMKENAIDESTGLDKIRERVLYISGIGQELTAYAKEKFISAKLLSNKYNLKDLEHYLDQVISVITENEKLIQELTLN